MKRPFAISGFSALLTLAVVSLLGVTVAACLMAVCAVLAVLAFLLPAWKKNRMLQVLFITMTVVLLNFTCHWQFAYAPSLPLGDTSAQVTATVTDLPAQANGRYYYTLETSEIGREQVPQKIKIRFSSQMELPVEPYDTIQTTMHFLLPDDEGGFSPRVSYRAKGIYLYAYAEDDLMIQKPDSRPVYWYVTKARQSLMEHLEQLLPQEEASMVQGILLGMDDSIPAEIRNDFRTVGISHLLAVSGMHTAVLVGFFLLLLRGLRVPRRASALICIGVVVGFMALTAFAPSVMRAGVMCILYLLGLAIRREADSLNSLGFAVLLLCMVNPFAAADIGLLLSFLATLGMILLAPRLGGWLHGKAVRFLGARRTVKGICMVVGQTLSANLFTLPVTIMIFGEVSLIAPVSNLLCAMPASAMMVCGGLAAVSFPVGFLHFLTYPLAFAAGIIGKYLIAIAHLLAQLPYASVPANQPYVILWLVGTLVLIGIVLLFRRSRRTARLTALISIIMLCSGIFSSQVLELGVTRITVMDIGNGTSLVISRGNRAAVIGCGGAFNAAPLVYHYLR
ncbi:MAG: ComEC family competence protein, partial [Clostridiales bacterium]|nr:ComEC family competence protein [Clostridiales bacterium]